MMNDLHTRYVSLVDEALQEAGGSSGGVGLEFFELFITGVGSGGLKEWLVDILTERVGSPHQSHMPADADCAGEARAKNDGKKPLSMGMKHCEDLYMKTCCPHVRE